LYRALLNSGAIFRAKIGVFHNSSAEAPIGWRRRNSCMKPDISFKGSAA
jgi:hypothetical protein